MRYNAPVQGRLLFNREGLYSQLYDISIEGNLDSLPMLQRASHMAHKRARLDTSMPFLQLPLFLCIYLDDGIFVYGLR